MLLVVYADDLIVLLVGWEVMGVCSYFLIGHYWELPRRAAGAVKAFLVTRLGDVGFLFGIFVLGAAAGTFRISGVLDAALDGEHRPAHGHAAARCCCCAAWSASRRSSRCTPGCPTRWPARRRSAR